MRPALEKERWLRSDTIPCVIPLVSLYRGDNAPLVVVEAIVGHSNPAMTRHYTHLGEAAATAAHSDRNGYTCQICSTTRRFVYQSVSDRKCLGAIQG